MSLGYEKSAPRLTPSRTSHRMPVYQRRSHKLVSVCLRLAGVWQHISVTGLVTRPGWDSKPRHPGDDTEIESVDLLGVNELYGSQYWSLAQLTSLLRSYEVGAGRRGCCTLLYRRPVLYMAEFAVAVLAVPRHCPLMCHRPVTARLAERPTFDRQGVGCPA
jgi:hypothetical protein